MKISVAMAYYHGEKYVKQQLESILRQLKKEDEVIVSVDDKKEGSDLFLRELALMDSRIHITWGPGKGVVRNFEHAISRCSGDIIFLSDQDDLWMEKKVSRVLRAFQKTDAIAVLHNAILVDENGKDLGEKSLFTLRKSRRGHFKNLMKNSYVGCCMAFRRELVSVILPIPDEMYMHDYWIGAAAESVGKVVFLREPLLCYRRHEDNVTELAHGSLGFMIKKRINILRCLRILRHRVSATEKEQSSF